MKIPREVWIDTNELLDWHNAAKNIRLKYGVYVEAKCDYSGDSGARITRLYFVVDAHEFESLNDLEKALNNKAFL